MHLRVRSNDSLLWNFKCREPVIKKRINIGAGTHPKLSAANVQMTAADACELLAQGGHPKVQRLLSRWGRRLENSGSV
ncbi:integrase arm-type DNA-binding domain-containing protein [Pseudomonas sp. LP_4_YM]|uniref:integrase arm-type DNA-binding domain-containing protein n=1 Tax=Pseudomonas sp. LP_4_YM TaxID=2485135 RepID=UPI0035590DB6